MHFERSEHIEIDPNTLVEALLTTTDEELVEVGRLIGEWLETPALMLLVGGLAKGASHTERQTMLGVVSAVIDGHDDDNPAEDAEDATTAEEAQP